MEGSSAAGSAASDAGPAAPADASRGPLVAMLAVFGLWAFAVAQPLLDVLAGNAALFVVRRNERVDLILLLLVLLLALPAALLLAEWLVGLVSRGARGALHLVFVAVLAALVPLPLLARWMDPPGGAVLPTALGFGLVVAGLYARVAPVRTLCAVLAIGVPLFAGRFLLDDGVSRIGADVDSSGLPPVETNDTLVFVVFDEFPVSSIMNRDMQVDAGLFPNFARLASQSTWFRNATAVDEHTLQVLPVIVSGKATRDYGSLAVAADHPQNLFTLFGATHRMRVREAVSMLCPDELLDVDWAAEPLGSRLAGLLGELPLVYGHIVLPETLKSGLPDMSGTWGGGATVPADAGDNPADANPADASPADGGPRADGAPGTTSDAASASNTPATDDDGADAIHNALGAAGRNPRGGREDPMFGDRSGFARSLVDVIDDNLAPTLYFLHVLFPHNPWHYLPSGEQYTRNRTEFRRYSWGTWSEDDWPRAMQRHLLQLGHVDQLLGELLDRLEQQGVLDRALVVVMADHGVSFKPGVHYRYLEEGNVRELMHVPLFIKRPFQREGNVSDRRVITTDVLPTLLDALDVPPPWKMDGVSAFAENFPARPRRTIANKKGQRFTADGALPDSFRDLDAKLRLFGDTPTWDDVFALGPHPRLLGRHVATLAVTPPGALAAEGTQATGATAALSVRIDGERRYESVARDSLLPCNVTGALIAGSAQQLPGDLAIAVNGTIHGTTRTDAPTDVPTEAAFASMLPASAWREGHNTLELFAIQGDQLVGPLPRRRDALDEEDGAATLRFEGRSWRIVPAALRGRVNTAWSGRGILKLGGWAADETNQRPADEILVLADDVPVFAGVTGRDIAWPVKLLGSEAYRPSGFELSVPLDLFAGTPDGRVRVFATSGDVAMELNYAPEADWIR